MSRAKSTSATAAFGRSVATRGWAKTAINSPKTEAYLACPRSAEVDDGEHPVHTFATRSKSGSAMTGCDCISMRVDPHPASVLVTSLPCWKAPMEDWVREFQIEDSQPWPME